jgi:hypothetical protein
MSIATTTMMPLTAAGIGELLKSSQGCLHVQVLRWVMTVHGILLAESIRVGASLEGIPLTARKIYRMEAGDVDLGQPRVWTFIEFEVRYEEADALADGLSAALESKLGWYCDFRSDEETFVVFAGHIFRYPRGDPTGRARAETYARSVGVPAAQLDWPE